MRIRDTCLATILLLAIVTVALSACGAPGDLLSSVKVGPDTISPNGDGDNDIAVISYHIGRSQSVVSITLADSAGKTYSFREREPRSAGDYQAKFSGVIETPLKLTAAYTVTQATVLPDGAYTVNVVVEDGQGNKQTAQAGLNVKDGNSSPPGFGDFSVLALCTEATCEATRGDKILFTPNQDGIGDRIAVSYWLTRESTVQVYLVRSDDPQATKYPISQVAKLKPGRHDHDYEGGVDLGNTPPPNGDYLVVAEAQDAIGNHAVVTRPLTIADGGVPLAQIVSSKITPSTVVLGGLVRIEVVVQNVGPVSIRSTGPYSGTVFGSDENYNTIGFPETPGAFRVGADFEGNPVGRPYPFRWGFQNDRLLPGQRQTVVGFIKIAGRLALGAPYFWTGLQHEQVAVLDDKTQPVKVTVGY